MTSPFMFLIIILIFVFAGAYWVLSQGSVAYPTDNRWPLIARPLLSEREQVLFQRLSELYPDNIVLAQVALSQLIAVIPGTRDSHAIRNRFQQLVADFVLCQPDFTVVVVIELDDSSHAPPRRQDADLRKNRAMESAGLRLVRIPPGPIPSLNELQQLLGGDFSLSTPSVEAQGTTRHDIPARTPVLKAALGLLLIGLVIAAAFMAISNVATTLPKLMGVPSVVVPAQVLRPTSPAPVTLNGAAIQAAAQNRQNATQALAKQQAADGLAKRRQIAWDQYFKPSASCEHPPAWADEVECGNQYIRAKRDFEKRWMNQMNSEPSTTGPDASVAGRSQSISTPLRSSSVAK